MTGWQSTAPNHGQFAVVPNGLRPSDRPTAQSFRAWPRAVCRYSGQVDGPRTGGAGYEPSSCRCGARFRPKAAATGDRRPFVDNQPGDGVSDFMGGGCQYGGLAFGSEFAAQPMRSHSIRAPFPFRGQGRDRRSSAAPARQSEPDRLIKLRHPRRVAHRCGCPAKPQLTLRS